MKTIDQEILESLIELDRDTGGSLITEMIKSFRAENPTQLTKLLQCISKRNSEATIFQAHAMKSTFGNFGALHLSSLLGRIEIAGKKSDWPTIETACEELHVELQKFSEDLLEIERLANADSNIKTA